MIRIIVCDDEETMRSQLNDHLERAAKDLAEEFSICTVDTAEKALKQAESADIILLDIAMEGMSGMDAAKMLRKKKNDICIIFVTSMANYAMEGYRVHAFGFLKKPVRYGTLLQLLAEAVPEVRAGSGTVLTFRDGTNLSRINSSDIYYIEILGHYVYIHTGDGVLKYLAVFSQLEQQLSGKGFFRCHKSYLINFMYIKSVMQSSVIMTDGSDIPISKYRRREFLAEFARWEGAD